MPLDFLVGGGCRFAVVRLLHDYIHWRDGSVTVEMASCFLLDVCLHLGGFVLVGWCIWHVGVLVARHHLHGEVVVCVVCRLGVVSVVDAVAVLAT